jgi:hypothetical protein
MYKIFRNKKLIAIAFFTVFSIAAVPSVMAKENNYALPVELKLVGNINNQQIFQLNFAGNSQENEFIIQLKDDDGYSLYRENVKGEVFSKKFLLNSEEIGTGTLRFEVTSKKSNKTVVFEVKLESHMVEEMVVKKVR